MSEGQSYCGPNTHCINTIGSFACNNTNCHEGFINWRQTAGGSHAATSPGCFQILGYSSDSNTIVTSSNKEYAVNKGKVWLRAVASNTLRLAFLRLVEEGVETRAAVEAAVATSVTRQLT